MRLPNGYYRITGRIKDMVIRGGENIYPREIEEFLFHASGDRAGRGGGRARPRSTAKNCAPGSSCRRGATLTEDEVRDFCRQNLAHYKVPRYVRFVEVFPQTVTGKIQKFKIREQMISELGLAERETA